MCVDADKPFHAAVLHGVEPIYALIELKVVLEIIFADSQLKA